jgi:hypothetical protein
MADIDLNLLKISFLPLGDANIASSRLRCYKLKDGLEKKNILCQIGFDDSCDILFIQKKTDEIALESAALCRQKGKILIFDIDDFPECPIFRKNSQTLASQADAITTATPEQKKIACSIFKRIPESKVFCLPNPIDYDLVTPNKKIHDVSIPLKIVWFGNIENYPEWLMGPLSTLKDVELHAITNVSSDILREYPYINFHDWTYSDFSEMISSFDLCILDHSGSEIINSKSANKMVTAISHGLPVLASRTPDYQRLAKFAGVDDWLFENVNTLLDHVERLRDPSCRNNYIISAQKIVWETYHIDNIIEKLGKIIQEIQILSVCNTSSILPWNPLSLPNIKLLKKILSSLKL